VCLIRPDRTTARYKGSAVIVSRELIRPEALVTAPVAPELHVTIGPKLRSRLLKGLLQRPPCFRWEIAPADLEVAKDVLVQPDPRGEPIASPGQQRTSLETLRAGNHVSSLAGLGLMPSASPMGGGQRECYQSRTPHFRDTEAGQGVLHFAPNPLSSKPHQIPSLTGKWLIWLVKHGTLTPLV